MSSRHEVLIRILALLQSKTLIETKNRTLKCLKRQYSTVRSMKNVAVLAEDGAFALFSRPHPGGFDSSRVPPPPREFAATWNRARLVKAKLSCFCWYICTHEMNPAGKFPKRPWEESTVH